MRRIGLPSDSTLYTKKGHILRGPFYPFTDFVFDQNGMSSSKSSKLGAGCCGLAGSGAFGCAGACCG